MVFHPPSWVPQLPFDPPDTVPIHEFMFSEKHGRLPLDRSRNPYTCGLTRNTYTTREVVERFELLSRSLAKRMGWRTNDDTPWDKVVNIFTFNSIDYIMAMYAIHRVNGIATPANAMYSAAELEYQLKSSGAKAIITCAPLLDTALKAAKNCGIAEDKVFLMQVPGAEEKGPFKSLDSLIEEGRSLAALDPITWNKGQGERQVAFLCYSSGTSGLPKAVKISHRNVIANIMQTRWHDEPGRQARMGDNTQNVVGLLPLSHIYGLIVVAHVGPYRGDQVVILPRFELQTLLQAVQEYKVPYLHLVPPIIIGLLRNKETCQKYDISSMRYIFTGAAPLGKETQDDFKRDFPGIVVGQGYGMTETATVVLMSSEIDVVDGTCGSLLPACRAKLIDDEGKEIIELGKRGELLIQSPSVTLGYLNNERATDEAYTYDADGRWLRTGDIAVVTKSTRPEAYEHFSVVDRKKELIKVKGFQVPPAELEAHLLSHPVVADCTVIPVPDSEGSEVPKAFVVKSPAATASGQSDEQLAREVCKHVEDHKSRYKWLKGGVEFIDAVPKSPSGKILRRLLKDKEAERRRAAGAKL